MECDEDDIELCRPEEAGHSKYVFDHFEKQDGAVALHELVPAPLYRSVYTKKQESILCCANLISDNSFVIIY